MGQDNTVKWQRLSLQLPPSRLRAHFVRVTVRVHAYPAGELAVYWGPHRLTDDDAAGVPLAPAPAADVLIASRDILQGGLAHGTQG